jgi:hypothetical protein
MRKGWILTAVAVVALFAGRSQAGFVFTYTVEPTTIQGSLKNVFKFYARNDQQGDQAGSKSLLAISVHLKPQGQPLAFNFQDLNGDGIVDADVSGKDQSSGNVTGSFVRVGSYADWLPVWVRPQGDQSGGGFVPTTAYSNVTDLWIEGFSQNKALDATVAPGQFYAAAVAPLGVNIDVVGMVAAEKGGIASTLTGETVQQMVENEGVSLEFATQLTQNLEVGPNFSFSFTAVAPEPSGVGLVALAGAGVLARRRARRR